MLSFFFSSRRRHTRLQGDWSSDVCSSDLNRQLLAVPHYLIEVVSAPPRRWSVVPRPQNARVLPRDWGAAYAVCPSCRERAALRGRPRTMECRRCRGQFEIAWDEAYLAD